MALIACRECGQPVSTEAAGCPHCGVGSPATPPDVPLFTPRRGIWGRAGWKDPWTWALLLALLILLPLGYVGYQHFYGGITVDGQQMEDKIVQQVRTISPDAVVVPSCPSHMRLHKDKIVECAVETPSGKNSQVFITPIDDSGHFRIQFEDPSTLLGQ